MHSPLDLTSPSGARPDPANPWQRIYVGVLTQVLPHPNADREVVVEVDAGWGRLTIVTGGPHIAVGHKVAVALPGARVLDAGSLAPRVRKLKKGRIRGVMSEGMLCSAKELGLSEDHSSIYVLAPEAPVGAPLATWLSDGEVRAAA
jgi:phenylalanyl-tRNA synthetase beta chain